MSTSSADPSAVVATGELLRRLGRHLDDVEVALAAGAGGGPAARTALAGARDVLARLQAQGAGSPPGPALVRRVELPARPQSAGRARGFTTETCQQWSLPGSVVSAATDLASELVANGVAHGTAPVLLALERGAGSLLVRVWDDGPGRPRVLPYRPGMSERGLGLRLVRQLSTHWGVAEEADGKWVWARIALQDRPAEDPPSTGTAVTGPARR